MYDKVITSFLIILIALTSWGLWQNFHISKEMVLVKEKISKIDKQIDEAVWNTLPETKEEEK